MQHSVHRLEANSVESYQEKWVLYDSPQRWVKDSATQAVSLTMELLGFGQPPWAQRWSASQPYIAAWNN